MGRCGVIAVVLVHCLASGGFAQTSPQAVRDAVARALPLLEKASAGSAEHRECFTCHSQALPVFAIAAARERGFKVDGQNLERQLKHTLDHLERGKKQFLAGKGTGGKADTAGYALWTLAAGKQPASETTSAVAEFLLLWQSDADHWSHTSDRPPSEASDFTTTFLAINGLKLFGTPEQQERIDARIESARDWLLSAKPVDTEDRVFRLRALRASGAEEAALQAAVEELIATQRDDGGWGQKDDMFSDAYATGTALVALHADGGLAVDDPVYQRGIAYLLSTQLEDGSWHVVSRSNPFQTYFETGFPHGDDQFISTSATGWATMALLHAVPHTETADE